MNANDVLIDFLEDNRRRLKRALASMSDDCLTWQPEAGANSIALTVWHMARILDVFLTRQAKGDSPEAECWFQQGWEAHESWEAHYSWAAQTGYDPRGIGQNGWGMLTGYTLEEAAAVPHLPREQLLGYLDQVYDRVRQYLAGTSIETLQSPCAGFEASYTKYQCIQMALLDNVRHLGEIFAIQARWERQIRL